MGRHRGRPALTRPLAELAAVVAKIRKPKIEISKWLERNDELVLHQIELHRQNPDMPNSTGSIERHLQVVRQVRGDRRQSLRNRRRLERSTGTVRAYRQGRRSMPAPVVFRVSFLATIVALLEGSFNTDGLAPRWTRARQYLDRQTPLASLGVGRSPRDLEAERVMRATLSLLA